MLKVFTVETSWIKKRGRGFFEGYPMFDPVGFRLAGIPIEH